MELFISVSGNDDLDLIQFREAIKDLSALAKGKGRRTASNAAMLQKNATTRAKASAKKLIAKGIAIPKSYEAEKLGLSDYFKGGKQDPSKK